MKNKSRWVMMLVIILVSCFSMAVYGQLNDVESHWAGEVINQWLEKGLVGGYSDGSFRPDNDISRAEFMVLVNNVFEYSKEEEINYIDVDENKWYGQTIKRAKAAGYISGYDDGTMKPNNPISRQEVAAIISRIMKLEGDEKAAEIFKDKDEIKWSKAYVGAVSKANYMIGFLDGEFKPLNNITRGESLYSLNNILVGMKGSDLVQAVAKQDLFGVTYIQVSYRGNKPSSVKANGKDLKYDSKDAKWKGSSLEIEKGHIIEVVVIENGKEVKVHVAVKDMSDN